MILTMGMTMALDDDLQARADDKMLALVGVVLSVDGERSDEVAAVVMSSSRRMGRSEDAAQAQHTTHPQHHHTKHGMIVDLPFSDLEMTIQTIWTMKTTRTTTKKMTMMMMMMVTIQFSSSIVDDDSTPMQEFGQRML